MAKKKTAKKKKGGAASRRKPSKLSSSKGPSKARSVPPRKIQLKPIKVLVERALVDLRRLPASAAIDITIKQLESCSMALSDICDPTTPGGCGESMEFDFPLALTSSRG